MKTCNSGKIVIKRRKGEDRYVIKLNIIDMNSGSSIRYRTKEISTNLAVGKRNYQIAMSRLSEEIVKFSEDNNKKLFCDFCWEWLKKKKRLVEETTYESYKYKVKIIVCFFSLLNRQIDSLSGSDIKEFYYYLQTKDRNVGRKKICGYANRTIKDVSIVLKMILNEAKDMELISKNPAERIKIPYKTEERRNNDYIDEESVEIFLEAIKGHELELPFIFCLYYGLRREEVLGLKWSAIHNYETLCISHTVTQINSIIAKDRVKTDASYRTYPISEPMKAILISIRKKQDEMRKIMGEQYCCSDYVFTWKDGRLYRPDYLTRSFKKIVKRNPYLSDGLTLHSLRSSCVSILIHSGTDIKDVQEWVGHKDINTTLNIYAKTNDKQKKKVDEKMLKAFSKLGNSYLENE